MLGVDLVRTNHADTFPARKRTNSNRKLSYDEEDVEIEDAEISAMWLKHDGIPIAPSDMSIR